MDRAALPEPGPAVGAATADAAAGAIREEYARLAREGFTGPTGILDEGIVPLADFVDIEGPAAVAIAVETDDTGDIHPAVYVRENGRPAVETLLPSQPMHDFRLADNRAQLVSLLKGVTAGAVK